MVARGDLAVEIPMESLANVQKEIVKRCNLAGTAQYSISYFISLHCIAAGIACIVNAALHHT